MLDLRREKTGTISLIGHRGATGYYPENTMLSFEKGLEMGANILELDIHLSRDGHLVVIHDFSLERTTSGKGLVRDHTLRELQGLDAGSRFDAKYAGMRLQIPTLDQVLQWAHGRVWLAIEIKSDWITYPGLEEKLVDLLRKREMVDEVVAISFDHKALRRVKDLEPNVAVGPLYSCRLADAVGVARATGATVMRPRWPFASAELADELHAAGIAFMPWGARKEEEWKEILTTMPVDGLSADHPDRLRKVIDSLPS